MQYNIKQFSFQKHVFAYNFERTNVQVQYIKGNFFINAR
jgi:hypothetical protein